MCTPGARVDHPRKEESPMKFALPLLLLAAATASCSGGDSDATPTPAATATATQPATAVPEPSPTPTVPVPRHIVLDTSPQEQPPETTRSLPPAPQASFPLWNGTSTVIYDRFTSQDRDLGPGAHQRDPAVRAEDRRPRLEGRARRRPRSRQGAERHRRQAHERARRRRARPRVPGALTRASKPRPLAADRPVPRTAHRGPVVRG